MQNKTCLVIFTVVFWFFYLLPPQVRAADPLFTSSVQSSYRFVESDLTTAHVTHHVTLTTQQPDYYPTQYTLEFDTTRVSDFSARNEQGPLPTDQLTVTLPPPSGDRVGATLIVSYRLQDLGRSKGSLLEITLPVFQTSIDTEVVGQEIEVIVPGSAGEVLMTSVIPVRVTSSGTNNVLRFNLDDQTGRENILLTFGSPQIYDLELVYHLANTSGARVEQHKVAFPPELPDFQAVYPDRIVPEPETIEVDGDGNVLGVYELETEAKVDVIWRGRVVIDSLDWSHNDVDQRVLETSHRYLIADRYWEVDAPEIQTLADELRTPEAIYDYVTEHLVYSYDKVTAQEIERAGALGGLSNPTATACMEFADLTIALMRAAGIPAREVNGYAYLEESEILVRPTVKDVLHAWVQYWDDERGWVNIDPTWGATTGRDYFHRFDFDHIIFVMKGVSSTYPYPAGAYRGEDVEAQDVKVTLADVKEPGYPALDEWLEDFEDRSLSWWERVWRWVMSLFKNPGS